MSWSLERRGLRQASLCVARDHESQGGLVPSIQTSTSYYHLDGDVLPYPRYGNTRNQTDAAKRIASLENAEAGFVFNSGMSAISTCVMSLVSPGDHVLMQRGLYGGTHSFLVSQLAKWGVTFDFAENIEDFVAKRRENTVLAYVESPTNPCLQILDLRAMSKFARETGVISVIDNTFASPINQNPVDYGFDLVVHSGTKYLGGHSDLTCGAVVGRTELIDRIVGLAMKSGGALSPGDCHLLERSLKTLDVRVNRQNENAAIVSDFLASHDAVARVLYPGLLTHPKHELAQAQMRGFGGMMSFELHPGISIREFLKNLRLVTPAMSLGGVESIVSVPVHSSHKEMSEEDRRLCGVTKNLLRLSVGIEHADDIVSDLDQAIQSCSRRAT